MNRHTARAAVVLVSFACGAATAHDDQRAPSERVGFEQHPGATLPLQTVVVDETGNAHRLQDFFGARPVIFVQTYYACPNLCSLVLHGVLTGARAAALAAGTDYALVVFSIDPRESPALANEKKAAYIAQYAPGGVQRDWHFLTATQPAIDAITRASGFRYFYDDKIGEYAHPAGALIVTPHGVISRYLFGVAFDPGELRLALAAAAGDRVGSLAERLWLLCYHYDPVTGKYGFAALAAVRAAALGSVLALGALFLALRGRERKPRGSRRNRE